MNYESALIQFIHDGLLMNSQKVDIGPETNLLETGIVDSLGMMRLLKFIEETFKVKVDGQDVVMENFMTVSALSQFVSTLKSKADARTAE